jgi:urease accessory protein
MFKSPFLPSSSSPGHGSIHLSILPPSHPVLTAFTYQYPLKLISPDPYHLPTKSEQTVILVFLLAYGGGLVAGDQIHLSITLEPTTRLALATQGSTKLFKSPSKETVSRQTLDVTIGEGAGLSYLPDPTQPFDQSAYEQRQMFKVAKGSSLAVLDWVSEGRRARGERWGLRVWKGINEVRSAESGRLMLRDSVVLDDGEGRVGRKGAEALEMKTDGMGIVGTLILYGPLFKGLGEYFLSEFGTLPRIGGRNWGAAEEIQISAEERVRLERRNQEKADGLLWTAANVRGFVLVKFGALEVEGARKWLGHMFRTEGSVTREFGEQAVLFFR